LIKALVILLVLMLQSELFRNQLKTLFSFGKARGGKT
jgi:simple sugar transport system permease protein